MSAPRAADLPVGSIFKNEFVTFTKTKEGVWTRGDGVRYAETVGMDDLIKSNPEAVQVGDGSSL